MGNNLALGCTLGHYRILKKIGAGGMGEVYLAEDVRLSRKVALKILPEGFAADTDRFRRFEQEARAASALNHPNILTVYEFAADGIHFLATELVEGKTLRETINGAEMPFTDALNIAEQIALALLAAHGAGIVHRDIKPENIMIRPDGVVKVLDFGIAKLAAPLAEAVDTEGETLAKVITQTKSGRITGTLNYMSPEQVRGQRVDARSDIFSLGVCLYEMLTGKMPFDKPTASDVIAAILTENPPSVTQTRPEVPAELQRIVGKALKKDKDERYQNSKDLLLDIKSLKREIEFLADRNAAAVIADPPQTDKVEPRQTSGNLSAQRFSPVHALAILLLAVSAIAGIWWLTGKNNSLPETNQPSSFSISEVINWRSAPGEVYSAGTISPDGKIIAFTSTKTGTKNIWIKQLSGGEAVQITKDEFGNQHPIWSPDGDEIAFYSARSGTPGIWRISSFGGTPSFIKTIEDGSMVLKYWSKKGSIYYEANRNLHALDIKSGLSSQLTDFSAAKVNPNTITISPDEKRVAYIAFENEQYGVWSMPVQYGASPKQVVSVSNEIRNPVWHPDSERIIYSMNVGGVFQVFAVNINGGQPRQVTFGDKNSFALDVSADGTKILYGSSKEESDVWGVNVEKKEEFSFAADIDSELWAAVSPDGKTVAFQSIKNLSQGDKISVGAILTKPTDSTAPSFELVANGFLPTWSPDGKQLAFMRVSGETFNLWTIKATGGEEKQFTTNGLTQVEYTVLPYNRTQASYVGWSPNGKKIAYVSKSDGRRNIWLVDADGLSNIQLTNNIDSNLFVYCPIWSPDGNRIAYSSKLDKTSAEERRNLTASVIDLETKNTKIVIQTENFQRLLGWSASGRELIFAAIKGKSGTGTPTEVSIIRADTDTGEQHEIGRFQATYLYNIYLSSDKKMLAYVSNKDGKDNVWVAALSGGEARKITSNNDARLYFSTLSWSPDNQTVYYGKQTRYSLLSMVTNFK